MKLPHPLLRGRLLRRYKRFLSDEELDSGETVTAHCANPGSMMGLAEPGMGVWLSKSDDPKRKLAHSWQLVEADGGLVGINTGFPNRIAEEAIRAGQVTELAGYATVRREVKYGENSRIDLLLENGPAKAMSGRSCYVEIKNVHLRRKGDLAEFPDSVTARGAKHLRELGNMIEAGQRAVMLFLVQRQDCTRFALADDIDPAYHTAFLEAQDRGVEMLCYGCRITPEEIVLDRPLVIETGAEAKRKKAVEGQR